MIDESTFWVITIGRKYARTETGIVGQNIEHAMKFTGRNEAIECAEKMVERGKQVGNKKPINVYMVSISKKWTFLPNLNQR